MLHFTTGGRVNMSYSLCLQLDKWDEDSGLPWLCPKIMSWVAARVQTL